MSNSSSFLPLVSIIIPVYNGSNYLKEAVDSAIDQTYKNIEILVINDGSNDDGATEKLAKSYGDKIRYFSKPNGGVATALNLGIEKMNGEYFSWLSHDDVYYSKKIQIQIEYLSTLKNKKIIILTDYELIDDAGKHIANGIKNHDMIEKTPIYALLRSMMNGITLLIPKKMFLDHGNFDSKLKCTQDFDMWYRVYGSYGFKHIPHILVKTRIHPNQDTNQNPLVLTEGNKLWIRMIRDLDDKVKIQAEGDLVRFYIGMIEHLHITIYRQAEEYSYKQLKTVVADSKVIENYLTDPAFLRESLALFSTIENGEAFTIFLKNVIRGLVQNGKKNEANKLIFEQLIGSPMIFMKSIKKRGFIQTMRLIFLRFL